MKPLFAIVLSLLAAVGPSAAAGETRTVPARTSAMEQARRETVARDLKHVREMLQAAGPAADCDDAGGASGDSDHGAGI